MPSACPRSAAIVPADSTVVATHRDAGAYYISFVHHFRSSNVTGNRARIAASPEYYSDNKKGSPLAPLPFSKCTASCNSYAIAPTCRSEIRTRERANYFKPAM
jgi:hypothetical protein